MGNRLCQASRAWRPSASRATTHWHIERSEQGNGGPAHVGALAASETAGHPDQSVSVPPWPSRRVAAAAQHADTSRRRADGTERATTAEQGIPARGRRRRAGSSRSRGTAQGSGGLAARRRSAPPPRRLRTPSRVSVPPWPSRLVAAAAQHADTSRRRASWTRSETPPSRGSRREGAGDEPAQEIRANPSIRFSARCRWARSLGWKRSSAHMPVAVGQSQAS